MTFALLQKSLGQSISRQAMEEASVAAPGIGRTDCARLQRQLYGIVVRKVSASDAESFRDALAARGLETELVPDDTVPRLPDSRRGQGLTIRPGAIVETDMYGREHAYPTSSLVFAAGGWFERSVERPHRVPELVTDVGYRGSVKRSIKYVNRPRTEEAPEYRLELFFAQAPLRIEWVLRKDGILRLDGFPVRYKDSDTLNKLLGRIRELLSPDRCNRGIAQANGADAPVYPSIPAFEEEIVWHLYRLSRRVAHG